ncbi:MAG: hypothetical protein U5J95_12060 [Balneolaceae bacterium]|nr:hypothetical protein [Balneolaceae bacterium]
MKKIFLSALITAALVFSSLTATAQFEEAEFIKVSTQKADWFDQRFSEINWTGQGLNQQTAIDPMQTSEVRALLQAEFGDPTLKIEDMLEKPNFRPGMAIQFEYRFVVNDSIPLIILDVFGPFGRGLSYSGASRYIDLMPQIKRTLARRLTGQDPAEYKDYYYSADKEKWYEVTYVDGKYSYEAIDQPEDLNMQ